MKILLEYGEVFREQVVDGYASPLMEVRVRVGGEWVVGGESSVAGGRMGDWLRRALEAVDGVCGGSREVVEFTDGPSYLVLEPVDEPGMVRVSYCYTIKSAEDPEVREEFEPSVVVSKSVWVSELVRTSREFVFRVVEVNPELADDVILELLREAIREVEAEYPEYVGERGDC